MNEPAILLFCICIILLLLFLVIFQRYTFHKGTEAQLREISARLSGILEHDSGEQVMVFTDNKALMELCGQINLLLLDRKKAKRDFIRQEISSKKMLSNISHDIKTPLTVILGYLEMMRLADGENESLRKVEAKAQQVMELINQFFTLAKLEAGDTDIPLGKTDLNELCRESILCFYDILLQKDFTVDIDIPEQTVFVSGNQDAIRRILSNLISNAVRYGSDGSYIGLKLHSDASCAWVAVTDKGKGIEKAFAASVFERLYTMDDSRNRNIHGNGLGLTIAKSLANQMGGDVFLESEPHVKTTFTLRLNRYVPPSV